MADVPQIEEDLADQQRILRGIIAKAVKDGKLHHAVSARADLGKVQAELHRRQHARLAEEADTDAERFRLKRLLAEGEGSWVAASKYALLERQAIDEAPLDEHLTQEEWLDRVRQDAMACNDEDLEMYVYEWLSRNGYQLLVTDGRLKLARTA